MESGFSGLRQYNENKLSVIWKKYLGLETVSVNDSFFELGGTSMIFSEVLAEINESMDIKLSVTDLFKYTTINGLADFVTNDLGKNNGGDELKQAAHNRKDLAKQKRKRRRG